MTQWIFTTTTDQYIYFQATPGLPTGSLTVEVAKEATSFTSMTTPDITEMGSDGDYALLMDEFTTIGAGNATENVHVKIKNGGTVVARTNFIVYDTGQWDVILTGNAITSSSFATDAISANALSAAAATEIAAACWADNLGSSGYSASALLQICAGVLAGEISGAESVSVTIRNVEDSATLINATVDANGNRSSVAITTPGD